MDFTNLKLVETLDLDLDLKSAVGVKNAIDAARGKFQYAYVFPFDGQHHIGYSEGLALMKSLVDGKAVSKSQLKLVLEKTELQKGRYTNVAWKLLPDFETALKEIIGLEAEDEPITGETPDQALERELLGKA